MGIMGCLGGFRARPKTQRRDPYAAQHWSCSSEEEEETRSCDARVEHSNSPQKRNSQGKEEGGEEIPSRGRDGEQAEHSMADKDASMHTDLVEDLPAGCVLDKGSHEVHPSQDGAGTQPDAQSTDESTMATGTGCEQHKAQEDCRLSNDRLTPRNPVVFLKTVIDDVIQWQAQVASINLSSGSAMAGADSCDLRDQFTQPSISRLRSTNEDLIKRVNELGHDLEKSQKEKHKLQASMGFLLNEKHRLEKEVAQVRGAREGEDSGQHAINCENLRCKPSHIPGSNSCKHASLDDASFDAHGACGLENGGGSLGIPSKRNSLADGQHSKLTKEDYIVTENKCLKMWISALQGSLSQMETEVTSLRREKAKLVKQVRSSFDSTGAGANLHEGRSSLLPLPPEFRHSQTKQFSEGSSAALSSLHSVSPTHRLAHQRMPRKSQCVHGHKTDSYKLSDGGPVRRKALTPNPILEEVSSNCNAKHLTYRQGTCIVDLRRSLPKWKP